jgi:hypothetical protein
MAGYHKDDPTFKLAKQLLKQHINFENEQIIMKHGIAPAVQFNSEAMMKYYFVEKGLKYRIPAFKFEFKEGGHTFADERTIWEDPEMATVPLEISVKDRSILKIDSKPINMKGATYDWGKHKRYFPVSNSYDDDDYYQECSYLLLRAEGQEWQIETYKDAQIANLILFFVHLNNPGYKEKKQKEEQDGIPYSKIVNVVESTTPAQHPVVQPVSVYPQEFIKSVLDSTTTAAVNIKKKKNKY